ncbi:hypothetical protein CYY_006799 [Polysphondylium violaceum]|uniref:Uncharacterized protein n=1 Tax=Polysphondylium violaceum TaxID=133409 RepID=A0A8J4PRC3_9MYCE|nr:hypothetical protein CYY_006799 [Polysphondylium violaceum]
MDGKETTATATTANGTTQLDNKSHRYSSSDLIHRLILYFNHCVASKGNDSNNNELSSSTNTTTSASDINTIMDHLLKSSIEDISFYAGQFIDNESLYLSLVKYINSTGFGVKNESASRWFYTWYNANSAQSKRFVLSFLPSLVWNYLYRHSPSTPLIGLESCLICIYNQEYIKRDGKEKIYNPPSLSIPSFIHKPVDNDNSTSPNTPMLTESMLKMINTSRSIVLEKPLPRVETIITQNRNIVIRAILNVYIQNLFSLPTFSRVIYCEMCTRISGTGYPFLSLVDHKRNLNESQYNIYDGESSLDLSKSVNNNSNNSNNNNSNNEESSSSNNNNHNDGSTSPSKVHKFKGLTSFLLGPVRDAKKRIYLSKEILQDLVTGLTFCVFQESTFDFANISLKTVNSRAQYDLIPEIILTTNSLQRLLETTLAGGNQSPKVNDDNDSSIPISK